MTVKLRAARKARGWSQARLIHEIQRYADHRALSIASSASLRVYVSDWENGRRAVSAEYAAILRALLGLTDGELFGSAPAAAVDGYDDLLARIDTGRTIGRTLIQTLTHQTELLRTMDRQIGSANLVDQMQAHVDRLRDLLTFAVVPDARRPAARALSEAASLAAWQALDVGAADRAWRNYELAVSAAREADDALYLAHARGEQAYVLVEAGRPELAGQLVREAYDSNRARLSPRLSAWLKAAEADMFARAGRADDCRRALDAAAAALPDGTDARDPDLPGVFLNGPHLARWRGHSLTLLGDEHAVAELYQALAAMDGTFVRAQAGLRCYLARAHLVRGERDEALLNLREARSLVNRTGSVRYRREIDRLTTWA